MRASINAMVLSLILTSACFGSRSVSDGDSDSGVSSVPESGVSDSVKRNWDNTSGSAARFDARITGGGRTTPPPSPPLCGNGIKEYGEKCDGTDFGGESCGSLGEFLGFFVGPLSCKADCQNFDTSMCYESRGRCGDAIKENGEICDGPDLGGETCGSLMPGFLGTLACAADCQNFDTSMCYEEPCEDDDAGVDC